MKMIKSALLTASLFLMMVIPTHHIFAASDTVQECTACHASWMNDAGNASNYECYTCHAAWQNSAVR